MSRKIITLDEAMSAGLKRYFTGDPCRHGHIADRFVSDRSCSECKDEAYVRRAEKKLARQRRERAVDPESKREIERRSYAAHRARKLAAQREYRLNNPEKTKEKARRQYTAKRHKEICAKSERGLESARASGALLDLESAIDIFKTHDNAFDFVDGGDVSFEY